MRRRGVVWVAAGVCAAAVVAGLGAAQLGAAQQGIRQEPKPNGTYGASPWEAFQTTSFRPAVDLYFAPMPVLYPEDAAACHNIVKIQVKQEMQLTSDHDDCVDHLKRFRRPVRWDRDCSVEMCQVLHSMMKEANGNHQRAIDLERDCMVRFRRREEALAKAKDGTDRAKALALADAVRKQMQAEHEKNMAQMQSARLQAKYEELRSAVMTPAVAAGPVVAAATGGAKPGGAKTGTPSRVVTQMVYCVGFPDTNVEVYSALFPIQIMVPAGTPSDMNYSRYEVKSPETSQAFNIWVRLHYGLPAERANPAGGWDGIVCQTVEPAGAEAAWNSMMTKSTAAGYQVIRTDWRPAVEIRVSLDSLSL